MRDIFFWAAVASCAAGQALIIRSMFRARTRALGGATPAGIPEPNAAVEFAWTLLPAVGLAAVLLFTWRAMHS
jgi:heme/copper-type cytochrome/quinol oxidase subunit 2